jgi:hypothetical protein
MREDELHQCLKKVVNFSFLGKHSAMVQKWGIIALSSDHKSYDS